MLAAKRFHACKHWKLDRACTAPSTKPTMHSVRAYKLKTTTRTVRRRQKYLAFKPQPQNRYKKFPLVMMMTKWSMQWWCTSLHLLVPVQWKKTDLCVQSLLAGAGTWMQDGCWMDAMYRNAIWERYWYMWSLDGNIVLWWPGKWCGGGEGGQGEGSDKIILLK